MTRKEPPLHTTPEALARAVVRTRPGPYCRWKLYPAEPDTPSWPTAVPISPMAGLPSGRCPQGNRGYSSPKKGQGGQLDLFFLDETGFRPSLPPTYRAIAF